MTRKSSNKMYTRKMVLVHTETIIGLDCPPVPRVILPHIEQDQKNHEILWFG